jgi:hypothetical protein
MHANQYFVYNATDLVGCLSHCNFAAAGLRPFNQLLCVDDFSVYILYTVCTL